MVTLPLWASDCKKLFCCKDRPKLKGKSLNTVGQNCKTQSFLMVASLRLRYRTYLVSKQFGNSSLNKVLYSKLNFLKILTNKMSENGDSTSKLIISNTSVLAVYSSSSVQKWAWLCNLPSPAQGEMRLSSGSIMAAWNANMVSAGV